MDESDKKMLELLKNSKKIAEDIQTKVLDGKKLAEVYIAAKMIVKGIEDSDKFEWEMTDFVDDMLENNLKTKLVTKKVKK